MNHRDHTLNRVDGFKRKSGLIAAVGGLALIIAGLPACGPNNGQGGQKAGQNTVQSASPRQKPAQRQQAGAAAGKENRLSPNEPKRHQ